MAVGFKFYGGDTFMIVIMINYIDTAHLFH